MEIQTLSQRTISSHLRALYSLIRKDWKQYWRYPLNAASTIFQPLIWIAPVYFMGLAFSVNGKALGFSQYSGTTDFMSFILLGTVLESFINAVFWGMGYALKNGMDSGGMESNWLTQIPRLLILVGHSVTNLTITLITSMGMLLFGALLFGFSASGDVLNAFIPIIPMMIGLYGFGFAVAAVVMIMREANTLATKFPVHLLPAKVLCLL